MQLFLKMEGIFKKVENKYKKWLKVGASGAIIYIVEKLSPGVVQIFYIKAFHVGDYN